MVSGGSERELGIDIGLRARPAMRASRATGLGASPEGLVNDGLDGTRAPATFSAATKAAIELLGIARKVFRDIDGTTDIVVAEDVAGTNNHEEGGLTGDAEPTRYL